MTRVDAHSRGAAHARMSATVVAPEPPSYAVRRWVTLAASVVASVCCGFAYAWSVLVTPMMDTYGWTSSEISVAFTLLISISAACTLVAGKALQYMQPRTLLLIGGAMLGIGVLLLGFATSLGLLYGFTVIAGLGGVTYPGATMTNLMSFFPDKRGLVAGLLTAGFGLGAVIWAPVAVALIDRVGLLWALRILGMIFFVLVAVFSRLVTTAPPGYAPPGWMAPAVRTSHPAAAGGKDWKAMLKTAGFWVLAAIFTIGLTSGLMVTAHASPIAQKVLGLSVEAAGAVVSYLAVGMVVGKIGWGALSDRIGRFATLLTMLLLAVLASLLLWLTDTYVPVVAGIFVVGACYGGFLALLGPVTLDVFGKRHFPVNFGIMFLTVALASYVGPRLGAAVAESRDGEYTYAFLIAALLTVAGLVLAAIYAFMRRTTTRTTS